MVPSYGPLETKQLLSETFFSPGLGFRDIRLDVLKWATLCNGIFQDKHKIYVILFKHSNIRIFFFITFKMFSFPGSNQSLTLIIYM